MFTRAVVDHWMVDRAHHSGIVVFVDDSLPPARALSVLELDGGAGLLRLTSHWADRIEVGDGQMLASAPELDDRLETASAVLHEADNIFHLSADSPVRGIAPPERTRVLGQADADAFARFLALSSEADQDAAFVELNHWLVVGAFLDRELGAAASAYPWDGSALADIGILTAEPTRGRGLARAAVQRICLEILVRGHEPLYRCQDDNAASLATAHSAGFVQLGRWRCLRS